jgi:hypothetical protein
MYFKSRAWRGVDVECTNIYIYIYIYIYCRREYSSNHHEGEIRE